MPYQRTFATLRAAERWRDDAIDALRAGNLPPEAPAPPPPPRSDLPTVEDVARIMGVAAKAKRFRTRSGTVYKPSVIRRMESLLRTHVVPRIGLAPVELLGRREIQRMVDEIAADKKPETARKSLHALSAVLRFAEREGLIDDNACRGVRVPIDSKGEAPIRVITPEEADRIVAGAEADDRAQARSLMGPLVVLALGTGLRSGELFALRWGPGGLDLVAGIVRVKNNLDRVRNDEGAFDEVDPKSRAGLREVPLDPADVAIMRRHRLATGHPPNGALVFTDELGKPLAATGLPSHAWRRALKLASLEPPRPRFHDLRHAWAIAMLRAGVRPEAVAKLGGWSDVGMVTRRYGKHALPDEIDAAGRALGKWREKRRRAERRRARRSRRDEGL